MSKLTKLIGEVVGPKQHSSGRSGKFFWITDENKTYRRGYKENNKIIHLCQQTFECWKLQRTLSVSGNILTDYTFLVKDKQDKFVGVFSISEMNQSEQEDGCIVIVKYTEQFKSEQEIHEYNRNYENMIEYIKVN